MQFDAFTLSVVAEFAAVLASFLLILSWLQNRSVTALVWWGVAFLIGAVAAALLFARGVIPDALSIGLANAILAVSYGTMWNSARVFDGRRILVPQGLAGAILWLAACQFAAFRASVDAKVVLGSLTISTYTLLIACEIWRGRTEPLMSRWPAIVFLVIHALVILARIPLVNSLPFPVGSRTISPNWLVLFMFEPLFQVFVVAFSVVMMAKERIELHHRTAALIDPLTGVLNRGAFMSQGEELLAHSHAAREPVAALIFDLDHFKQINDNHGHHGGDLALVAFTRIVAANLRSSDIIGRLGGEEFACLLPQASLQTAAQIAEHIRAAFAGLALDFGAKTIGATVSAGAAIAFGRPQTLSTLLACADSALYRAKGRGRNRVEWDRPQLAAAHREAAPVHRAGKREESQSPNV